MSVVADMSETPKQFRERMLSIGVIGHRVRGGHFVRDLEKRREKDLSAYRESRKEGIQPDGTQRAQIERAKRVSDRLGVAYRGDDKTGMAVKAGVAEFVPHTEAEKRHFREK